MLQMLLHQLHAATIACVVCISTVAWYVIDAASMRSSSMDSDAVYTAARRVSHGIAVLLHVSVSELLCC